MQIARVTGTIVATRKQEPMEAKKLLLVQPLDLEQEPTGPEFMAMDSVGAGVGELVLVCNEGGSANTVFETTRAPFDSVIVGIIDAIDLHGGGSAIPKEFAS